MREMRRSAVHQAQLVEIHLLLTLFIRNIARAAIVVAPKCSIQRGSFVTEVNSEVTKDEKVVVARSTFNVANVIAAIALLLLVLGLLKWLGASPF
jgi:hypothetical protein